jgi:hypothetical protein
LKKEVQVAIAPSSVRVSKSLERLIQLNIGFGKRSDDPRRNFAGRFNQRGKAQVWHIFGVQERTIENQGWRFAQEDNLVPLLRKLLQP